MSLVNLSHVCSSLSNASHARLGLFSIPYTRLHLSLALLLHKQGFLSSVNLGGPSPPAVCFPARTSDTHRITAAPVREREERGAEAALWELVHNRRKVADLEREGWGEEALDFALQHSELTKEQLDKDGWDGKAIDFLLEHGQKSAEQLDVEDSLDSAARNILTAHDLPVAIRIVQEQLLDEGLSEDQITRTQLEPRLRTYLRKQGFSRETLAYFAGPARFTTPLHLDRDGITLNPMGVEVSQQTVTSLPPALRDPDALESSSLITRANRASRRLWLGLKYAPPASTPVLSKARMVSKPTKRIWLDSRALGSVARGSHAGQVKGLGRVGEIMVVSTDRGVMEVRECVERGVGGMVLCRIW
ncbi:hypothetical protein LTR53_003915 [Teratosphaeriaceae sp. CCFEE 6253]|nr:hypothetical protein LTR53_003915 [Teratosphaeriaceae sp. CCFEE 6253]